MRDGDKRTKNVTVDVIRACLGLFLFKTLLVYPQLPMVIISYDKSEELPPFRTLRCPGRESSVMILPSYCVVKSEESSGVQWDYN